MTRCKILSTKKLLPELVALAAGHGIEVKEQEFISVKPVMTKEKWEEVFKWVGASAATVVFTSAHAVEAVNRYLHPYLNQYDVTWKIFCLSGRTKLAVEQCQELKDRIVATADNATSLAEKIRKHQVSEVIFFCGDQRRDELPQLLSENGIRVNEVTVYQTVETPIVVNYDWNGILFFSPSAVNSFFSLNRLQDFTLCFAIGSTTAQALSGSTTNRIITSKFPSQESMMELVLACNWNDNN